MRQQAPVYAPICPYMHGLTDNKDTSALPGPGKLEPAQRELLDKSVDQLRTLARKIYPDKEEDHEVADAVLCDMLDALGCHELVEAWEAIEKWYS